MASVRWQVVRNGVCRVAPKWPPSTDLRVSRRKLVWRRHASIRSILAGFGNLATVGSPACATTRPSRTRAFHARRLRALPAPAGRPGAPRRYSVSSRPLPCEAPTSSWAAVTAWGAHAVPGCGLGGDTHQGGGHCDRGVGVGPGVVNDLMMLSLCSAPLASSLSAARIIDQRSAYERFVFSLTGL